MNYLVDELLEGLLITAIEGGSNYWSDITLPEEYFNRPELPFSTRVWLAVTDGLDVAVMDAENMDFIGSFNYIEMVNALFKMNIPALLDDYDAFDADIWFQYVVMGEQTYA